MASTVAKAKQRDARSVEQPWSAQAGEPMRAVFAPRTDIVETEADVVVLAEMPGVAPDDVDVTLERGVLTLRGRAAADEHPGYRLVYAEYAGGDYERVFTLGREIDQDNIEATFENGLLRLRLPKAASARPRRIELRTG